MREPATLGAHVARSASGWPSGYWLVLALLVLTYVLCAAQDTADPSPSAFVVQLFTVAVVLRVTDAHRRVQRLAWIVLTVAGIAAILVAVLDLRGQALDIALSAASMLAFLVAPVAIIRHQVRRRGLDTEALLAAISAYALVGMFFALVYNLVALLTVVPTFGPEVVDSLSSQLFFSFTTLTTTGYGNIVPVSPAVQGIAVAEAITGQLFLITAVARIMRGNRRPAHETASASASASASAFEETS
ncbi:two pore domain potassium channel family protein [Microbacterium foliorum]|uniref:Two pore domain potassium channel family protein n=2 Tax=Microbacterium foliorum TaxID=104336 RepID=A0A4Y5YW34_9MICO|nr:two pore domain potassium channel family protein [Microbacterium foliorum]